MSHLHDSDVSRRQMLCGGGAAIFSYLVAGLLGGAKAARAQALSTPVPEVDRLAVRVVTDSYQLAISPSTRFGDVDIQRFGMPPAGKSLVGEFGLSMHVESRRGNETRRMLIDFGDVAIEGQVAPRHASGTTGSVEHYLEEPVKRFFA